MIVKNFSELSSNSVTNAVFICIARSVEKSAFAERNIRSLKKTIRRYLEEKWTYS